MQEEEQAEADEDKFNLKKARYEVRQFGLSGFSFEDREKCEADRAVTLGAWVSLFGWFIFGFCLTLICYMQVARHTRPEGHFKVWATISCDNVTLLPTAATINFFSKGRCHLLLGLPPLQSINIVENKLYDNNNNAP